MAATAPTRARRGRRLAAAAGVAAALLAASPAGAQAPDPAAPADELANVVGAPSCPLTTPAASWSPAADCRPLADPELGGGAGLLGSASPEDELAAQLRRMADPAGADDALRLADALAGRDRALAVLEGGDVPDRAWSGLPLLNWNAPAKVRTLEAGRPLEVRIVRFPGHAVSDTWMIRVPEALRDQPFTIRYRVAELGSSFGGMLAPAPLSGTAAAGQGLQSALQPLGSGEMATGTKASSRFTDARRADGDLTTTCTEVAPAPCNEPERTRLGEQTVEVRMPAPGALRVLLDPNERGAKGALATLHPWSREREDAARGKLGFSDGASEAQNRAAAIARLAADSPERQVHTALAGVEPGSATLAALATLADGLQLHVATMRARNSIPPGLVPGLALDPADDLTVVLANNETYVSRRSMRLPRGGSLRVRVVNRDGFAHDLEALALHNRRSRFGALDWGRFDWSEAPLGEAARSVAAGGEARFTLRGGSDLPADAFAVWVGDPRSGDQASTVLSLDREPRTDSIHTGTASAPLHDAVDEQGRLWATLEGGDAVTMVEKADDVSQARRHVFPLPTGASDVPPGEEPKPFPLLGPSDIQVDGRGIVWVTLSLANKVARIDPAQAQDGTTNGIKLYALAPCPGPSLCAPPLVPEPGMPPGGTREPGQMDLLIDHRGNTVLWFTEAASDQIAMLRVAPDGGPREDRPNRPTTAVHAKPVNEVHFSCGCRGLFQRPGDGAPSGLALDARGDVWFAEPIRNRIGRLTPGTTNPDSPAESRVRHFKIPSGVPTIEPELAREEIFSSVPHSVTVDRRGRVWFTESATGKLGALDPEQAVEDTDRGMTEVDVPKNAFRGIPVPADLAFDGQNSVFWADEYGDVVGRLDASGPPASWRFDAGRDRLFMPGARRSLTDQPVVDQEGNVWFTEVAGDLLTRISNVAAPTPGPSLPAEIETNAAADTVAGAALAAGVTVVEVTVRRAGETVSRAADAAVTGGRFRVGGPELNSSSRDPLRAGDQVRVEPRGRSLHAPIVYTVPRIAAAVSDGAVAGTAQLAGESLGEVTVGWTDGAGAHSERVPVGVDGRFSHAASLAAGQRGTVAWSTANAAAVLTTVSPFPTPPDPEDPRPASPPPSAPAPAPAGPEPGSGAPRPAGLDTATARACRNRRWLFGRPLAVLLLGAPVEHADACLGRASVRAGRRRYGRSLELSVANGRVTGLRLLDRRFASDRGGLRLGAGRSAVRRALPRAAYGRRSRTWRATLPAAGGRRAIVTVRLSRGRAGVVRGIEARLR